MHKFEVKLPKIIKTKYNGPGWLYFYEEQKFITITTDHKIPQYYGTWPIQVTDFLNLSDFNYSADIFLF